MIPIVFIPGIMGSNLRLKPAQQKELERDNNVAWRPDSKEFCLEMVNAEPEERQTLLDPTLTEVDEYDPVNNPTGDKDETADERHSQVDPNIAYGFQVGIDTPLLTDDPVTQPKRRTRAQKARERGWGEVYYSSYSNLLELCEMQLNAVYPYGRLSSWWRTQIVGVPPAQWQAAATPALQPLDEATLQHAVKGCWFPVHAMGYNWLQSNEESAVLTAARLEKLIQKYQQQGFECQKVILITHSMGGLMARAMVHPGMGNIEHLVLGVVHGVMPALGAAATYKRMRCGFEGVAAQVLGKDGQSVTAVLANAQGGLELLPSPAYGAAWLTVTHQKAQKMALPEHGDPYEEIYKLRDRWYRLLIEEWINPSRGRKAGYANTCLLLDKAKIFHSKLAGFYHPQSYAHYGADTERRAWRIVDWKIQSAQFNHVHEARLVADTGQGGLRLLDKNAPMVGNMGVAHSLATMRPPADPGDETVPTFSADDQLRSGKVKGIFRQTGYEHQGSYKADAALFSTLYSIIRIAATMEWK